MAEVIRLGVGDEQHAHCWHITTTYYSSDAVGSQGCDVQTCCHCGHAQSRAWVKVADPAHGPHIRPSVKKYLDEMPEDEADRAFDGTMPFTRHTV